MQATYPKKNIRELYKKSLIDESSTETLPSSITQIKERLIESHKNTLSRFRESREMTRLKKKKRKRNIGQGIASSVFGVGVIVANTQLPTLFAFSYGLGGAALHQAMRDIVGFSNE